MAERPKLVIPQRLKDKHGEKFKIWSFSRINTFHNCKHEYWLSRILKLESLDNVYTMLGTYSHTILEDFYNNKINQEDMVIKFETDFIDVEVSDYKFSSDEDKNTRMRDKYKECVVDFFKCHQRMAEKVAIEKLIWIDVEGNVFMGYVDAIHKENDCFIITDFKTSSIYTGKKIKEHGKQLLLYSLGLIQGGVPIDKVKAQWLFLKYCNITYQQKNGKFKTTKAERNKWVEKIKNPLKMFMKEHYPELEGWEIDLKVDDCIKKNSLSSLDKEIQDKFEVGDCFVEIEINQENIDELKKELTEAIQEIESKGTDEDNWQREDIEDKDTYYCSILCGVKSHCKYYKKHLEKIGKREKNEEDILKDLDEILNFD